MLAINYLKYIVLSNSIETKIFYQLGRSDKSLNSRLQSKPYYVFCSSIRFYCVKSINNSLQLIDITDKNQHAQNKLQIIIISSFQTS